MQIKVLTSGAQRNSPLQEHEQEQEQEDTWYRKRHPDCVEPRRNKVQSSPLEHLTRYEPTFHPPEWL